MQTLGLNAQPVLRSHRSDINQLLAKKSRASIRIGLTHSQASSPHQCFGKHANARPWTTEPFPATYATCSIPRLPGTQISRDDYTIVGSEQWSMQIPAGFVEPDNMRASSMSVFPDQAWPSDDWYGDHAFK